MLRRTKTTLVKAAVAGCNAKPLVETCKRCRCFSTLACASFEGPASLRPRRHAGNSWGQPPWAPLHCARTQRRSLQSWTNVPMRNMAELEQRLSSAVGTKVEDPVLGRDLASLQWLHQRIAVSEDGTTLQMLLRVPTLMHPSLAELKDAVRSEAESEVKNWLVDSKFDDLKVKVNVEAIATKPIPMMAHLVDDHETLLESLGPGLSGISHFLAVYSCKGGVGKSTVAVNLAYELSRMGGRVGLLDLDVYGPSLPVLIRPDDVTVRRSSLGSGMVEPIDHHGVKALSLGFVSKQSGVPGSGQGNGASVMRGPMAGSVVSQLLKGTEWGELDVLVLDMPPGTGDVQLQVLQDLAVSCAVAVTTPSKLSAVDTRKGIEMFSSLGVSTVAVVENMAYFECPGGGTHYPFGSTLEQQREEWLENLKVVQLPVSVAANKANDDGEPLCLFRPDGTEDELKAFSNLAKAVSANLLQLGKKHKQCVMSFGHASESFDIDTLQLTLDSSESNFVVRVYGDSGAMQMRVTGPGLRARDPKTGDMISDSPFKEMAQMQRAERDPIVSVHRSTDKQSPSIVPRRVTRKGRYGYAVEWADGATIIYSMISVARAAGGRQLAS